MNANRHTARPDDGLEATNALETGLTTRQEKSALCVKEATQFETHKITHHPIKGGL